MNRRYIALVGLSVSLALMASALGAAATSGPSVSADLKHLDRADDVRAKSIRTFVETQLARLNSPSLSDQQEARDALLHECDTSASPVYVDTYVQSLVAALPQMLQGGNAHARLNAGVVVGRIAERTKNLRLKPAALALLADKDNGVQVWGARTARALMLPQLRIQVTKDEPLLTEVLPAINGNLSGYLVQELYEAYRLNILSERRNLTPEMLKAVIPPLLELFGKRVALYAQAMPDQPQSETLATSFLGDSATWGLMTEPQKTQTLQNCSTLVAGIGSRITELDVKDPLSRARRDELIQTIRLVSSAVNVIAQLKGDKNLENAAGSMAQLNPTFDAAAVSKLCAAFAEDIARSAKSGSATATSPAN